jgi:hypothetical protein
MDEKRIAAPARLPAFNQHIGDLVEQEARTFFGECPGDLFLVVDDPESLQQGKFRRELQLLCDLFHRRGWRAELGCPAETRWDGRQLLFKEQAVSFIVNRSTDFFWQSEDFSALRAAYQAGRVYVAPNPFTYATRSDKRLLEWLSLPHWDKELEIEPDERRILNDHSRGQFGRTGAKKTAICVQTSAWICWAWPDRQRRSGASASAPSHHPWSGLCSAKVRSEALLGNRWRNLVDGPPRLGLPWRDFSPFGTRLRAAGPVGVNATRRMAANLCVSLGQSI